MKKLTLIIACIIVITIFAGCNGYKQKTGTINTSTGSSSSVATPTTKARPILPTLSPQLLESTYNKAVQELKNNRAIVAYSLFCRLGDYKDSIKQATDLRYSLYYYPFSYYTDKYIKSDGTIGYDKNFSVPWYFYYDKWKDLNSFCDGEIGVDVTLKNDGTINIIGSNFAGDSNITKIVPILSKWTNVVQVIASDSTLGAFYAGLLADGTVLIASAPMNKDSWQINGFADIAEWKNIIQITFYDDILIGLQSDGQIVVSKAGLENRVNRLKITPDESNWYDTVMISGDFALKKDGSVSIIIPDERIQIPKTWVDISAIFSDQMWGQQAYAMKSDGTIINQKGAVCGNSPKAIYVRTANFDQTVTVIVNSDGTTETVYQDNVKPTDSSFKEPSVSNILLPKNQINSHKQNAAEAELRFNENMQTNIKTKTYPFLGGNYTEFFVFTGSNECGYRRFEYGLMNKSDAIVIQPKYGYLGVIPLTDDRFYVQTGNPPHAMSAAAMIIDKSGNKINKTDIVNANFIYKDNIRQIGIGYVRSFSDNAFLIDLNGNRINDDNWAKIEFIDNGQFTATKDGVDHTLDKAGNIIK